MRKTVKELFRRGGGWVAGQAVLMVMVLVLGPLFRPEPTKSGLRIAGLLLLGIGGVCGALGARALGRHLTPFPEPTARARLVQTGIYGLIRHPLYAAVIAGAVGWSLVWGSWPALAVSGVLAVFLSAKAGGEEVRLRQAFPEYPDYERRVKRFIPWLY